MKRKILLIYIAKNAILFFAILLILDWSIGAILRKFYFTQESGFLYRTTYALEKTDADILVFGSSRANHHYSPSVFENRFNESFYNAGRDGNFMFYHYAILQGVLKRYTPKKIILDFISDEFKVDQSNYDRLSALLPYYKTHPEIRPVVELKGPYERLKLLSDIYPFNSSLLSIAVGNAEFNKRRMGDVKGYIISNDIWANPQLTEQHQSPYELDTNKIKVFESFIRDCLSHNIELSVVTSPYYRKFDTTNYSIRVGKDIAARYKVSFFDFSTDTFFVSHPELFADANHLNNNGATIFGNRVADSMMISRRHVSKMGTGP